MSSVAVRARRRPPRLPPAARQLVRFALVGGAGYAVNLGVYALLVRAGGVEYHLAAVLSFAVALAHNFLGHRCWTFRARSGRPAPQATRFTAVSVLGGAFGIGVLHGLVALGAAPLAGQAVGVLAATPLTFVANRRWSFRC